MLYLSASLECETTDHPPVLQTPSYLYRLVTSCSEKSISHFNRTVNHCTRTAERSDPQPAHTYKKRRIPVLANAKARPRMPLPMMALLRLKTDIPREVVPGIWRNRGSQVSNGLEQSTEMPLHFDLQGT